MPFKCYFKPNRSEKRSWTDTAVGRVACYDLQGGGSWKGIKEASRERGCLTDDVNCDCEQVRQIITLMLEAMALALVVINLAYPAIIALMGSSRLRWAVRLLLGARAAEQYDLLPSIADGLKQIESANNGFIDMHFNSATGMWENVPMGIDPINIVP
jgi:hypothetical protein